MDTSVLIALGRTGYLGLLPRLFDDVLLAVAVVEEVGGGELHDEVEQFVGRGLARVAEASNLELVDLLSSTLGRGEAETIALALDVDADLVLLDDLRARKAARRLGVRVMGTLGILKLLMDNGYVRESPEELCRALVGQGFWVDVGLCLKILGRCESGQGSCC